MNGVMCGQAMRHDFSDLAHNHQASFINKYTKHYATYM